MVNTTAVRSSGPSSSRTRWAVRRSFIIHHVADIDEADGTVLSSMTMTMARPPGCVLVATSGVTSRIQGAAGAGGGGGSSTALIAMTGRVTPSTRTLKSSGVSPWTG